MNVRNLFWLRLKVYKILTMVILAQIGVHNLVLVLQQR
jgi:hypothetical protein